MKTSILALLVLFSICSSFAGSTSIKNGDIRLSHIRSGEITSADGWFMPNCPNGAQCQPAGRIIVKLTLGSCVDRLGPWSYHFRGDKLIVSAINIQNERSASVRCIAPGTATKTIYTRPFFNKKIKLIMMR